MSAQNFLFGTPTNVLMLLPVTGSSGGNRKRTVVTMTYAIPKRFANHAKAFGSTKGRGGNIFLPRKTLIAMGIA